jgi:uroporphyrinogen III methyltransferase/synthase
VAFVTGQESAEKQLAAPLDYADLARFPGTLVFYMGVTKAPEWSRTLIEHGKPPETPVAIVRRCSLPDQETIFTTLVELATVLQSRKLRPPAVIIVGDVARERNVPGWFISRPLFGRTVLVTRPEHQGDPLARQLSDLGANIMLQPAIEIGPPRDWSPVDEAIHRLAEFHWLVFASANGVEYFLQRLFALGHDARKLSHTRLAAIGPATGDALARYFLKVDLQPEHYRAEALAEALAPHVARKRVLVARASRGREVLGQMVEASGAAVEQVVVYENGDVESPDQAVSEALAAGQVEWTTVTSPAIARSLVRLFGASLRRTRLAAISPLTADVLAELGYPPAAVAETYTGEGIISALLAADTVKP